MEPRARCVYLGFATLRSQLPPIYGENARSARKMDLENCHINVRWYVICVRSACIFQMDSKTTLKPFLCVCRNIICHVLLPRCRLFIYMCSKGWRPMQHAQSWDWFLLLWNAVNVLTTIRDGWHGERFPNAFWVVCMCAFYVALFTIIFNSWTRAMWNDERAPSQPYH